MAEADKQLTCFGGILSDQQRPVLRNETDGRVAKTRALSKECSRTSGMWTIYRHPLQVDCYRNL